MNDFNNQRCLDVEKVNKNSLYIQQNPDVIDYTGG